MFLQYKQLITLFVGELVQSGHVKCYVLGYIEEDQSLKLAVGMKC